MAEAKAKKKGEKYRYLRLPLATPAEAEARRAHLIKTGTIRPAAEEYACGHAVKVVAAACPECGVTTVVWR